MQQYFADRNTTFQHPTGYDAQNRQFAGYGQYFDHNRELMLMQYQPELIQMAPKKVYANKPLKCTKVFVDRIPHKITEAELKSKFMKAVALVAGFPRHTEIIDVICREGYSLVFLSGVTSGEIERFLPEVNLEYQDTRLELKLGIEKLTSKTNALFPINRNILVGNLTWEITPQTLIDYFSTIGEVQKAYVLYDPETNYHKGFGYVVFVDLDDAKKVASAKVHVINNIKVLVKKAKLKDEENFIKEDFDAVHKFIFVKEDEYLETKYPPKNGNQKAQPVNGNQSVQPFNGNQNV